MGRLQDRLNWVEKRALSVRETIRRGAGTRAGRGLPVDDGRPLLLL